MKKSPRRLLLSSFLLALGVLALPGCPNGSSDTSSDCPIVVTSFAPASGKLGDTVTITGQNLGGLDAAVGFSGAEATPLAGSTETMLIVQVPLGAQTAPITVDVPSRQNCQASSAATFTVTP